MTMKTGLLLLLLTLAIGMCYSLPRHMDPPVSNLTKGLLCVICSSKTYISIIFSSSACMMEHATWLHLTVQIQPVKTIVIAKRQRKLHCAVVLVENRTMSQLMECATTANPCSYIVSCTFLVIELLCELALATCISYLKLICEQFLVSVSDNFMHD